MLLFIGIDQSGHSDDIFKLCDLSIPAKSKIFRWNFF